MTKGAEELKLIFIFGIEPYAQILTLAAYVASQFVFQFIYTDGLGTGNYLCALGMPGFRGLTELKRLLTGCLAWCVPLSTLGKQLCGGYRMSVWTVSCFQE